MLTGQLNFGLNAAINVPVHMYIDFLTGTVTKFAIILIINFVQLCCNSLKRLYFKKTKPLLFYYWFICTFGHSCNKDILHSHYTTHIIQNDLISNVQHGFMKNRSTLTQQLNLLDEIAHNYDNKIIRTACGAA